MRPRVIDGAWRAAAVITLACGLAGCVASSAPTPQTTPPSPTALTKVVLVRHAEKVTATDDPDPVLTTAGRARAERLAIMLRAADVVAIYSSEFQRTRATVAPLAAATGLAIVEHPAGDLVGLARRIRRQHRGGTVVVAGHSNTVPGLVEALGAPPVPPIPDDEYDNLYVVTLAGDGSATILRLRTDGSER